MTKSPAFPPSPSQNKINKNKNKNKERGCGGLCKICLLWLGLSDGVRQYLLKRPDLIYEKSKKEGSGF